MNKHFGAHSNKSIRNAARKHLWWSNCYFLPKNQVRVALLLLVLVPPPSQERKSYKDSTPHFICISQKAQLVRKSGLYQVFLLFYSFMRKKKLLEKVLGHPPRLCQKTKVMSLMEMALKGAAKKVVESDFDPFLKQPQIHSEFCAFLHQQEKIHLLEKDCFCTYRNPLLRKGRR